MSLRTTVTPRRVIAPLVVVQVGDALLNVVPSAWIEADLEHLRLPQGFRYVSGTIKFASAAGLLAGLEWPRLGRLTARLLVAYFVLALGAHVRIKDRALRYAPALAMLGWSALAVRCYPAPSVSVRSEPAHSGSS